MGTLYQAAWEGGDLEAQWRRLAEVIAERDPEKIAVNVSATWPVADGLSHGLHRQLQEALGDGLSSAWCRPSRWLSVGLRPGLWRRWSLAAGGRHCPDTIVEASVSA